MSKRTPDFARVLGTGSFPPAEADGILAVGFAMANANGDASFEELDAFRALVKHVRPGVAVMEVLDDLGARLDAAGSIEAFVRAVAPTLGPEGKDAAYKAACVIAVFDLETNEDERDLDDLLVEVLGLGARAGDLELAVNEALST